MAEEQDQQAKESVDMRLKIIKAAIEIFAKKGFTATTISDISSAAGANRALIYYYFKDKHDLYQSILHYGEDQVLKIALDAQDYKGSSTEKLRVFMSEFSKMLARQQDLTRLAIREKLENEFHVNDDKSKQFNEIQFIIRQILEEGIASGELRKIDPVMTVCLIFGMTHSLIFMRTNRLTEETSEENLDHAISILTHGISNSASFSEG